MDKLRINLIPPQIKEKAKKEAKRAFVNKVSIGLLGLLILFTAGVLIVVVIQRNSLDSLNSQLEEEKNKISALKDNEAIVNLLKDRINTINQFTTAKYKQGDVFNLMMTMFPSGVVLDAMQIDKSSKVTIQGQTNSTLRLESFFNNLTDPKVNEGQIAKVSVESLTTTKNGSIRFDLQVTLAEGVSK